jgi:hypothetical protein
MLLRACATILGRQWVERAAEPKALLSEQRVRPPRPMPARSPGPCDPMIFNRDYESFDEAVVDLKVAAVGRKKEARDQSTRYRRSVADRPAEEQHDR